MRIYWSLLREAKLDRAMRWALWRHIVDQHRERRSTATLAELLLASGVVR